MFPILVACSFFRLPFDERISDVNANAENLWLIFTELYKSSSGSKE